MAKDEVAKLAPAEPLAVAVDPVVWGAVDGALMSTVKLESADAETFASLPMPLTVTALSLKRFELAADLA